ncbi:N-acyl amino acid synthase FeeM domain-containing protein [Candidatus Entotheonella palauensis]|uniref:N-acyl amino acid synthase FeeM domain-containing protein n=1 Tax=Candidatus Entotheonella palauensis TaxID=93172 RepID=UPI0004BC9CB7|nr:hypothetical protein [Candidatus Entotheonella palauensis]
MLAVRHRILVDEDGYLPDQGGYIVDVYDALPTTANFIVLDGTEVIGGVRLTADSEAGMASDTSLDFLPLLSSSAHPIACSLFCLRQAYRDNMKPTVPTRGLRYRRSSKGGSCLANWRC